MKKLLSVQQRAGITIIAVCGSIVVELESGLQRLFLGLPSDPVQIESIHLLPDPPIPGQDLTVIVDGTVLKTLEVSLCLKIFIQWDNISRLEHMQTCR